MEMPNADKYEQPEEPTFPEGTIQALMQEVAPDPREHKEDMYRIKEFADLVDDAHETARTIEGLCSHGVLSRSQADTLLDRLTTTLTEKLNLK
jgi:hypothetical protein